MTQATRPRCYRCSRPEDEGTGWTRKEHYREGAIFLHDSCPERVCLKSVAESSRSVRTSVCGRDAKEETPEGWLCGRHLAGYRRRQQSRRETTERHQASDHQLNRAQTAADILAELEIQAIPYYSLSSSSYDGRIVVSPEDIFRLAGIGAKLPEAPESSDRENRSQ